MKPIKGIHHITAMAKHPQENVNFYHHFLGQRLVKKTVNFDDPGTYHLYYGDHAGSPGTIMTFFPWPNAARGQRGHGEVGATAYTISPDALEFWVQRLTDHQIEHNPITNRFGEHGLSFEDPDGMILELICTENTAEFSFWEDGPIPQAHALRGFHSATLWVKSADSMSNLLTQQFGYAFMGQEDNRHRFQSASDNLAVTLDVLEDPGLPEGRFGAGSVHHIAFRVDDDAEQLDYQETLIQAGYRVTEVKDRNYFHSIYFRTHGGVLFEIATDPPGFSVDEPVESLGTNLKLPPWYEDQRSAIESVLPPLSTTLNESD